MTEDFNDIYLNLAIRKSEDGSIGKTDEFGNYIFEVEASNENLDLQNQIVLQRALLASKDEFLKGGVISCDHLHKRKDKHGNMISDESMVIGEPIDVKTNGKSTIVVGKLYKTNKKANEFIDLLKAGSTRVRASVGGIFPKVINDIKTGVEKVTSVLWNDLALTVTPVNNTVGYATFAKSMNPDEFCKALMAGTGTDHAAFAGGRALISEDTKDQEIINELVTALKNDEVNGETGAIAFLMDRGLSENESRQVVREIVTQGGEMMKKSFSESIEALLKSLKGNKVEEDDFMLKADDEGEDIDLESEEIEFEDDDTDEEDEEDEEDEVKKGCKVKKSLFDDEFVDSESGDEFVDGTEYLVSLQNTIEDMQKSIAKLTKQQNSQYAEMGKALTDVAEMVHLVGGEKMPARSVMTKSVNTVDSVQKSGMRPTQEEFEWAQSALIRAVREGKITAVESSMISHDMQKSMATGSQMNQKYYKFLVNEYELNGGK